MLRCVLMLSSRSLLAYLQLFSFLKHHPSFSDYKEMTMLQLEQLQLLGGEASDVMTAKVSLKHVFLLVAVIPTLAFLYPNH